MVKRIMVIALIALLGVTGFVLAADVPTVTVMQNWPKGFDGRSSDYEDLFWERAEQELGIKIDMNYATSHGDFVDKLPVMVASGTAPDIVLYADMSHYAMGLFESLTPFIERSDFPIEEFFDESLNVWSQDGQIYALPTSRNHGLFVYNTDLFAQSGIADPPGSWGADGGWTWDYVREIAQKLTQSDGDTTTRYGMEDFGWVGSWPQYFGTDWVDEEGNLIVSSPETVDVISFFVDFYRSGFRGGNIMDGSAAMTNGMSWTVNSYIASGYNLGFAPTPMGTVHSTETWVDGAAILQASNNKDVAWTLLQWLFQPENVVGFYTQQWNYLVPMRGIRDIWEDHMFAMHSDIVFDNNYAPVLFEAGPYGSMTGLLTDLRFAPIWANIRAGASDNMLFGQGFWDALDGEIPVASWLSESQRLLSNTLAQMENR